MTHDDATLPITMPLNELRTLAVAVAEELQGATLTPELRERFITVRTALFQRGIFDPVLVRFDTASAPRATLQELGAQLATVAASLA